MTQSEAKRRIQELVSKYEQVKSSGEIQNYSEQSTKDSFIRPLFEALGWDFTIVSEVSAEENVQSVGRADYGMRLNGQVKFYLEAKKLSAELYSENHAKQAISYSFNRVVTWAVLTDFEGLIVFNAQSHSKVLEEKKYLSFTYKTYLDDFDKLWLLSKEAFTTNELDNEARKVGKLREKLDVTVKLAQTLNEARELLTKTFNQCNSGLSPNDLDEGVQKLLDRLIFLRVAEDRLIEPNILMRIVREWKVVAGQIPLYRYMIAEFRKLDKIYNSGLFSKHDFENWEEYGGATETVVKMLYGEEGYYDYNFGAITTDVLGAVYENYLGYQLAKSRKGLSLDKSTKKRKEQGIYYTPAYIEDYILEQALQPVLDQCTSVAQLKTIKVVDPACGSGSFLVKALQMIARKYESFGAKNNGITRAQILLDNIYGVDLDEKAVELARLNLLISAFDSQTKLPGLDKNIRQGNSLISGTDDELKKYFGKNYRDKKPFNWEEEFPEVFNRPNPGFDVIIGNPPWVSITGKQSNIDMNETELSFLSIKYNSNTYAPNLYEMFIYLAISLVRENGLLSYVIPDRLFYNSQFINLRKLILSKMSIRCLWFGVKFPGIIADTAVFCLQNSLLPNHKFGISVFPDKKMLKMSQNDLNSNEYKFTNSVSDTNKIALEIIKRNSNSVHNLSDLAKSTSGCGAKSNLLHRQRSSEKEIEVLKGSSIQKYEEKDVYYFDFQDENLTGRTRDERKLSVKNKILVRKTGKDLIATFDSSGRYPEQSLYFVYDADEQTLLFILGLINSQLMNYFYHELFITNKDSTPQLKNIDLNKFPIIIADKENKLLIIKLVKDMLMLKRELKKITENSNKWNDLIVQIEKTNKQIDQLIYKLYGLTEEETMVIQNN